MTQERRRQPEPAPKFRPGPSEKEGPKRRPLPIPNGFQDAKITVSMEQKVNLGNYESASAGLILSGVPVGTDACYIDEMLNTGKLAWDRMKPAMQEKMRAVRRDAVEDEQEGY